MRLPRLRAAREHQALSQRELAERAGLSRVTVTRIERGEGALPITVRRLAQALGVRPADLMAPEATDTKLAA